MGLANFDGTALYEHADPRQGFHPDWKSFIFNYGRHEVAQLPALLGDVLAGPLPRDGCAWTPSRPCST